MNITILLKDVIGDNPLPHYLAQARVSVLDHQWVS
jgi:hypothetical protein